MGLATGRSSIMIHPGMRISTSANTHAVCLCQKLFDKEAHYGHSNTDGVKPGLAAQGPARHRTLALLADRADDAGARYPARDSCEGSLLSRPATRLRTRARNGGLAGCPGGGGYGHHT